MSDDKLNHVMVDLETLGRSAGCAILSIGAVKFDPATSVIDADNAFYRAITLESCVRFGLHIDPSTVKWWADQPKTAQAVFNDPNAVSIQRALVEFAEWVDEDGDYDDVKLWGNGANFDNPILSRAYEMVDIVQPWKFWNDRCYRTKKAENKDVPFTRVGTYHNALDDAVSQALHLCEIYRVERERRTVDIAAAVNKFLSMQMPADFGPDCYIVFDPAKATANNSWPVGTNLFTADQARAMFEHCLGTTKE